MREGTLFELVKSMNPPPCEAYKCKNFYRCGVEKIACYSFQRYVTGGSVWPPTVVPRGGSLEDIGPNKKIYDKLFNDVDDEL